MNWLLFFWSWNEKKIYIHFFFISNAFLHIQQWYDNNRTPKLHIYRYFKVIVEQKLLVYFIIWKNYYPHFTCSNWITNLDRDMDLTAAATAANAQIEIRMSRIVNILLLLSLLSFYDHPSSLHLPLPEVKTRSVGVAAERERERAPKTKFFLHICYYYPKLRFEHENCVIINHFDMFHRTIILLLITPQSHFIILIIYIYTRTFTWVVSGLNSKNAIFIFWYTHIMIYLDLHSNLSIILFWYHFKCNSECISWDCIRSALFVLWHFNNKLFWIGCFKLWCFDNWKLPNYQSRHVSHEKMRALHSI